MLLRGGATVIATTRFRWILHCVLGKNLILWIGDRLKIHGLDLRHIPSVEIL
jgi:hypothetical protein